MSEIKEPRISVSQQGYSQQRSIDRKVTNRSAATGTLLVEKHSSMNQNRGPDESNLTELTPSQKEPFQPKFKLNTAEAKRNSVNSAQKTPRVQDYIEQRASQIHQQQMQQQNKKAFPNSILVGKQPKTLADQIQHPYSNQSNEFLNEEQSEEPIGMFDLKIQGRQQVETQNQGHDRSYGRTAIFQRNKVQDRVSVKGSPKEHFKFGQTDSHFYTSARMNTAGVSKRTNNIIGIEISKYGSNLSGHARNNTTIYKAAPSQQINSSEYEATEKQSQEHIGYNDASLMRMLLQQNLKSSINQRALSLNTSTYPANPTTMLRVRRKLQTQNKRITGREEPGKNRPTFDNEHFFESKVTNHTNKTRTTLNVANNFKLSEAVNINSTNMDKNFNYDGFVLKNKPQTADVIQGRRNQLKSQVKSENRPMLIGSQQISIVDSKTLHGLQISTPFSEGQSQAHSHQIRQETQTQVKVLQDKVVEQQDEIKQLRKHLRDLFQKQEDEIVALSYKQTQQTEKSSTHESTFQSKQSPGKYGSARNSYREVSNIHQLYQDLFITDMKDEIDIAGNELQLLRQELLLKEHQMAALKKQNQDYQGKLSCYRRMVADAKYVQLLQAEDARNYSSTNPNSERKNYYLETQAGEEKQKMPLVKKIGQLEHELSEALHNGQFIVQVAPVKSIFKADSMSALNKAITKAYKVVMGAKRVNFYFLNQEVVQMMQAEGIGITRHKIQNQIFCLSHPANVDQNAPYNIETKFSNITDVLHYRICSGSICVWPINHFENDNDKICFIQLEAEKGRTFNLERDRKVLDLIALLQTSVIHKLISRRRMQQTKQRSMDILRLFKYVLRSRSHTMLCRVVENLFPKLFGFQYASMLYVDYQTNDLFKLRLIDNKFVPDEEDANGAKTNSELRDEFQEDGKESVPLFSKVEYSSVLRIPSENGITGISIKEKRVVVLQTYDKQTEFSVEIDNNIEAPQIKSMMIGPLFNDEGKLKGIVQLINKLDDKQISEIEAYEFQQLLPTIAQVVVNVDQIRDVLNVSTGVDYYLLQCRSNLESQIENLDDRQMSVMHTTVSQINKLIHNMINRQKTIVFSDRTFAQEVIGSGMQKVKKMRSIS